MATAERKGSPRLRMRQIPLLHFSYGHRIMREVEERGVADLKTLFAQVDAESVFKSDREHRAPVSRGRSFLRFARDLGLMAGEGGQLELTPEGRMSVQAREQGDDFATSPMQAQLLREQIEAKAEDGGIAWGAALALSLVSSAEETFSDEELGRALGVLGGMHQWREPKTYDLRAQGGRFRALRCSRMLASLTRLASQPHQNWRCSQPCVRRTIPRSRSSPVRRRSRAVLWRT